LGKPVSKQTRPNKPNKQDRSSEIIILCEKRMLSSLDKQLNTSI